MREIVVPDGFEQAGVEARMSGTTRLIRTASMAGELSLLEKEGNPDWRESALCAQTDPEAFTPEKGGSVREAKKVCLSCEVRDECGQYALDNDERFGVWGGLSERERRKLKNRKV